MENRGFEFSALGQKTKEREKVMAKKTNSRNGGHGQKQAFAFSAPDAVSVQLVGDFTHWQERPINLQKGADGVWRSERL